MKNWRRAFKLIALVSLLALPLSSFAQLNGVPSVSTSTAGTVSGTYGYFGYVSATTLTVGGVAVTSGATGDRIVSGSTSMVANSTTSIISITNAGVTAGYFNSNGVLTAPGISATANLTSVTSLYASGKVGVGLTSPNTFVAMDVSGSIRTANGLYVDRNGGALTNYVQLLVRNAGASGNYGGAGGTGGIELTAVSTSLVVGTYDTLPLIFGTNNAERARIDATGNVSLTGPIKLGTSSLTCASAISGTMRYNATSNTMEYCNSSAWSSLSTSSTSPVAFSVHKGGTDQTVTAGVVTKLTWNTETFDTNNNFTSDKFTPTVAGKYLVTAAVYCNSGNGCATYLYKNGSNYNQSYTGSNVTSGVNTVTSIVDMNGTTDYLEIYGYNQTGTSFAGTANTTYFEGVLLSPQGGGAGGTATPAGSTADVQYNSGGALAADTGVFTYSSGVLKATTTSSTNLYANSVSGTTGTFGSIGTGSIAASGNITVSGYVSSTGVYVTNTTGTVSSTWIYGKAASFTTLTVGGVAVTGAGASTMASLTDVSETGVSSGMLLRYNGTKWESVGASTALSTTTMIANWPDGIVCYGASGSITMYRSYQNGTSIIYVSGYTSTAATENFYMIFNATTGAWSSKGNAGAAVTGYYETNCNSSATTVSSLYASGNAFNFVGSNLSSALGTNTIQYSNNGVLAAATGITYNSATTLLATTGSISATGVYVTNTTGTVSATFINGSSVSGTTGTFGTIGSGPIAATGISVTTNQTSVTTLYASGRVGIGRSTPSATLDVNGGVKVADDTATCDSTKAGTVRFVSSRLNLCDGIAWANVTTSYTVSSSSQDYSSPGTYSFNVPVFNNLTVTVKGASGGSGGAGPGNATAGGSGTSSSFGSSTPVVGNAGGGGLANNNGGGGPWVVAAGAGGTATGGDTNTTGGAWTSVAGGIYATYGTHGGDNGLGGLSVKTWTNIGSGAPTIGVTITVIVGTAGSAGAGSGPGGAGHDGDVLITWN
jgi:hypothetical protein